MMPAGHHATWAEFKEALEHLAGVARPIMAIIENYKIGTEIFHFDAILFSLNLYIDKPKL
jgi:hypothetical protein